LMLSSLLPLRPPQMRSLLPLRMTLPPLLPFSLHVLSQELLCSDGVLGADEPLTMGSSSQSKTNRRWNKCNKKAAILTIRAISMIHYESVMEGIHGHKKTWKSICVRKATNHNKTHNCVHYLNIIVDKSVEVLGIAAMRWLAVAHWGPFVLPLLFHHVMVALVTKSYMIRPSFHSELFTAHRYYQDLCTVNFNNSEKHSVTANFLTRCIISWLQISRTPL
jgi:hypothetical protein